ncbi:MAG TPA: aldehyde dehydrogenase family protein, partial [Thermoanaerobaculia bacterium]
MPSAADIDRLFDAQRRNRAGRVPTSAGERIEKLGKLIRAILSSRGDIRRAMWEDYRKPAQEVDLAEIYAVVSEARHARRHLRRWMKPRRIKATLPLLGT